MTILRRGSRGPDVAAVQRKLGVTVDGEFGPKTEAAVIAFQRRHRLDRDGVVGPKTRAALFPGVHPPKKRKHAPGPRRRALAWLKAHRGITEDPPGRNCDRRSDGITAAQRLVAGGGTWLVGLAWCGVWACAAALHAGLTIPKPYRWASVAAIEDDARAGVNGFESWTTDLRRARPGDLVVLFSRGTHVETVTKVDLARGVVHSIGGNTSSGDFGSQSNGGGAFARIRPFGAVHGIARVAYPQR